MNDRTTVARTARRRLIVNADDFGLSPGVNVGIVKAFRDGIVRSATVMVNQPAVSEAFALARAHPGLGVGVHFVLTGGRPVADRVDSLTGPDGTFLRLPELGERAEPEHIRQELQAQLERFLASGLRPTHFDSHHHVCGLLPAAGEVMLDLAADFGVPVRHLSPEQNATARARGVATTDAFDYGFYGTDAIGVDALLERLAALGPGTTELMTHPAFIDDGLRQRSSYAEPRLTELTTLTDRRIRSFVREAGIELISYREL